MLNISGASSSTTSTTSKKKSVTFNNQVEEQTVTVRVGGVGSSTSSTSAPTSSQTLGKSAELTLFKPTMVSSSSAKGIVTSRGSSKLSLPDVNNSGSLRGSVDSPGTSHLVERQDTVQGYASDSNSENSENSDHEGASSEKTETSRDSVCQEEQRGSFSPQTRATTRFFPGAVGGTKNSATSSSLQNTDPFSRQKMICSL